MSGVERTGAGDAMHGLALQGAGCAGLVILALGRCGALYGSQEFCAPNPVLISLVQEGSPCDRARFSWEPYYPSSSGGWSDRSAQDHHASMTTPRPTPAA